jgi:putative pyruvate formate lyase activating enzyme
MPTPDDRVGMAPCYNPAMEPLPDNVLRLARIISDCTLCPRRCRVDRTQGRLGACRVGQSPVVASAGPHFGEEPVLVGSGGSGTIFFCGCNLDCVFCQNHDISHAVEGQKVSARQIANVAMNLEREGCVNINFVSPTHVSHAVAEAIVLARRMGLKVPTVYNCGGYESVEALRLLSGLIEIYMPDFKYASAEAGMKYSGVADYPQAAQAALEEMYRQVGPLVESDGLAARGVLVRHLVMPGDIARSREVIDIVARTAPGSALNVMGQYHPAFRAGQFPELMSHPSSAEIRELRRYAVNQGLVRAD